MGPRIPSLTHGYISFRVCLFFPKETQVMFGSYMMNNGYISTLITVYIIFSEYETHARTVSFRHVQTIKGNLCG